jgi:hypothetical protein
MTARAARIATVAALAAGAALLTTRIAAAHHAYSMYDNQQDLSLNGTVREFLWINPHCRIVLLVVDPGGQEIEWRLTGRSPNALIREGWTRNSIRAGDKALIVIHPARDGGREGSIVRLSVNGTAVGHGAPEAAATP